MNTHVYELSPDCSSDEAPLYDSSLTSVSPGGCMVEEVAIQGVADVQLEMEMGVTLADPKAMEELAEHEAVEELVEHEAVEQHVHV